MKAVSIQFIPWDKAHDFYQGDLELIIGDKVIVDTNLGLEIGRVVGFKDIKEADYIIQDINLDQGVISQNIIEQKSENKIIKNITETENKKLLRKIIRKATSIDLKKVYELNKNKQQSLEYCKQAIEKYNLPMKLVDVFFAFDNSRITFIFTASERVDFRELVKDLTNYFNKTIRLQQISFRDRAKLIGDYGYCGRQLCCKQNLTYGFSVSADMVEIQQIAHRGSDRISGICGRLMCCLAYENKGYLELTQKLPAIGTKAKINNQEGVIIGWHTLRQTVDIKFPREGEEKDVIMEVKVSDLLLIND